MGSRLEWAGSYLVVGLGYALELHGILDLADYSLTRDEKLLASGAVFYVGGRIINSHMDRLRTLLRRESEKTIVSSHLDATVDQSPL